MTEQIRPATRPTAVRLPVPRAPKYGPDDDTAVAAVLNTGRLSDIGRGPQIAELETRYAAAVAVPYALSFNSGTAALHAALHALGAPGDERGVLTSPLTWISAIAVAFHAGTFPVFADLEPGSVNLDPAAVPCGTTTVLATHAFGVPARVDTIDGYRDRVVEDCSHAHGAVLSGAPVGSWGAAGCFSLMDRKPVSAGEGGILTTATRRVYETAMTLGHHPDRLAAELTDPDLIALAATGLGYKTRMPVLAAAIGAVQLAKLPARAATASDNLATLIDTLATLGAPAQVVAVSPGSQRGWYRTPLWITKPVPDPDRLYQACRQAKIPVRAIYNDWLTTPLLNDPALLAARFPHLRHTGWHPPDPSAFPHYYTARRQLLLLKLPDLPAADYLHQVGEVLAHLLERHL